MAAQRTSRSSPLPPTRSALPSDGPLVAGCNAYVMKPCLPENLLREIVAVLFRFSATRRRA